MAVQYTNLGKQWEEIAPQAMPEINDLLKSGKYIGGTMVARFEQAFARFCGTKYAVGTSSGTDALSLCFDAEAIDDDIPGLIITQANTFVATAHAASRSLWGLQFLDCNRHYQMACNDLEHFLKYNTRDVGWSKIVIVPVHMYGHPANMAAILNIAEEHGCVVIEDASHAHGAVAFEQSVGSFGKMAAFSLYPGKPLGACGDAGVITTNDPDIDRTLRRLRNQGQHEQTGEATHYGGAFRLDPIQAIVLYWKLGKLPHWNNCRERVARQYDHTLPSWVTAPPIADYVGRLARYAYPIRVTRRDALRQHLTDKGIGTAIHYPWPVHRQHKYRNWVARTEAPTAESYSKELLSLPFHPFMTEGEVEEVVEAVKEFGDNGHGLT